MSDNNKSSGKRDSFAKPGDENIVSGKSFFLSFGKNRKSPSNPLIESEKQKNAKKNETEAASKQPQSFAKGVKGAKTEQEKPKVAQGARQDAGKPSSDEARRDGKGSFGKHRNDRRGKVSRENTGTAPREQEVKVAEDKNADSRQERSRFGKGRNDRRPRPEQKSSTDTPRVEVRHEGGKAAKQSEVERQPRNEQARKGDRDRQQPKTRPEEKQVVGRADNDRKGKRPEKPMRERPKQAEKAEDAPRNPHQKPKKEKFVPTSQSTEITDDSLLQPIVNRTGIITGSKSGILGNSKRSRFGIGIGTAPAADTEEEKVYVKHDVPLAEQIEEYSKPKVYSREPGEGVETVEIVGVRFRRAGKVYYFAPGAHKINQGDAVIVETSRGTEYGFCAIGNRRVPVDKTVAPLMPIIRKATKDDTDRYLANKDREGDAARIFKEKVAMLGLEMSLVYVEYTFDNGRLLFYFTADGRVDFRELIKELAGAFRTRIELRQIGVRDEVKLIGGLGVCGREACCASFLGEFCQVSMKMAKDQNLILNHAKISGTCGRIMCCLKYEDEMYQREYERTPKVDAIVSTPEGKGVVVESNALKGVVKVLLDDKPQDVARSFKCTEVKILGYTKRENEKDAAEDPDIPEDGSGS